jgi:cell division septation protein DedD
MGPGVPAQVSVDLNEQNLPQKELASPVSPTERPLSVEETEFASGSVHVVVGAFGEEGNANRLKEKLLKQGYQVSAMHSIKVGKLYRVVLEAPAGVAEEAFLIDIKKEVNPAAWFLAK